MYIMIYLLYVSKWPTAFISVSLGIEISIFIPVITFILLTLSYYLYILFLVFLFPYLSLNCVVCQL